MRIITASNAANPNQVIVLWGSGVGYDPADDDKLYPQKQNNLTNVPMKAYVGGVEAAIAYRGRSQFPGVDQVVLTIPSSVPTGLLRLAVDCQRKHCQQLRHDSDCCERKNLFRPELGPYARSASEPEQQDHQSK